MTMALAGRIDAHHHLWDAAAAEYPWMVGKFAPLRRSYSVADIEPELKMAGIESTIVVQARSDMAETRELMRIAAQTTFISGVVGWADLTSPLLSQHIDQLLNLPGGQYLVGLRHGAADEPDPNWLRRADVDRALRHLGDADLTFDLEITTREMPAASALVRNHPNVRFVLDHAAKPPIERGWSPEWADLIGELASAPNVWCKLSGLVTEADWQHWTTADLQPYVEYVLSVFGTSRVMFGSDWPVCELAATYDQVYTALNTCLGQLEADDLDKVFGRNAADFYALVHSTPSDGNPS